MHGAEHERFDDMASGYFEKPPSRARPLIGFKAPQALKDKLDAIVLLWQIRAEVDAAHQLATKKFKDPEERKKLEEKLAAEIKAIDFTYVCTRVLGVASDEALGETLKQIGFDHVPSTDDEWTQAKTAFLKNAKSR